MFSNLLLQVTAFDNRNGSKYLLETDLTTTNLEVGLFYQVIAELRSSILDQ